MGKGTLNNGESDVAIVPSGNGGSRSFQMQRLSMFIRFRLLSGTDGAS
jgi:hypothetical protein